MNQRRFATVSVLGLVAVGVVALLRGAEPAANAAPAPEGPPPAPVKLETARLERLRSVIGVPGSIVSRNHARVASEVAGLLTFVAEVGDRVREGDVIARVEDGALALNLREGEAEIRRLEAQLGYLRQQVERLERLAEQGIVSAGDLDEVVSQRQSVAEQLAQAAASRDQTAYQRARSELRAPFAGQVAERLSQPGSYAGVGTAIVQLVDTRRVEVQARAPLAVARYVSDGMRVGITLQGGSGDDPMAVEGRVRTIVPVGDERSRMLEVRVSLPPGEWVIGSPVRVALPSTEVRQGVAVSRDALVLRQEGTFVFKLDQDGKAERVAVRTGIGHGDLIEISGDVAAGDSVVVRGAERLRPGQAVEPVDDI